MRAELLQLAADLARREEAFVLAVVVRRLRPSSSQLGDMALITAAGGYHGSLGGSCTRPTVVREAQAALADGRPRLLVMTAEVEAERRPGVDVFPMTCHSGGSVEIYLEPVLPAPRLVVFGASATARALAALGKMMGYAVVEAGDGAAPASEPEAATDDGNAAPVDSSAAPARGAPRFAVVATFGENDEEAIQAALGLAPAYLGVVASARRFAEMRQTLLAQGVPEAALAGIHCPAGLDIGARTPEEIALSILAEIVERRRAATTPAHAHEPPMDVAPSGQPPEAAVPRTLHTVDPVCGMTVEIAGARHTADHAGRAWYFCCGGCRQKFLAAPERFAAAAADARGAA